MDKLAAFYMVTAFRAAAESIGLRKRYAAGYDDRIRFAARVNPTDPDACWLWEGPLTHYGYGNIAMIGKGRCGHAHRFAYEWLRGPIPEGYCVDHLCRTRACVNPFHLEPVTIAENVRRGVPYRDPDVTARAAAKVSERMRGRPRQVRRPR